MIVGVMEGRAHPLTDAAAIARVPCPGIRTFISDPVHVKLLSDQGKQVVSTIQVNPAETDDEWRQRVATRCYAPAIAFEVGSEPKPEEWDRYFDCLAIAGPIIRNAGGKVVMAGSPPVRAERFYQAAQAREAWGRVDGIGLHPYIANLAAFGRFLGERRAQLDGYGATQPLYLTEFGAGSGGLDSPMRMTEAGQASYLTSTFGILKRLTDALRIAFAAWFLWRDYRGGDGWPHHAGVLRGDASPKPSYDALAEVS